MDGNLVDRAEVDVLPHRARIIIGIDDLQIPFANLGLRVEMNVDPLAVLQNVLTENVVLPVIGLARRDEQGLQLVAGAVDEGEILLGIRSESRGRADNRSGGKRSKSKVRMTDLFP
jgi:hypothetical protein